MPLSWPTVSMVYGDLPEADRDAAKAFLDIFGDAVASRLSSAGLSLFDSPLWKPWSLFVGKSGTTFVALFTPGAGSMNDLRWHTLTGPPPTREAVTALVRSELGWESFLTLTWQIGAESSVFEALADEHVAKVRRSVAHQELGDLSGLAHLDRPLQDFLTDHPRFDRNVFVMMRFASHTQLTEVYEAVKATLSVRGFDAFRADERDYTGELWTNIQTYMHGSKYGIAIFEDFTGARELNPNVSLELGYMVARQKRTLILREQTLPNVPADVMHRLYRPFDMFSIGSSIERQVGQWADVDLGGTTT